MRQPTRRHLCMGAIALAAMMLKPTSATQAGDAASRRASETERRRERRLIRRVQTALAASGFDPGPVDGLWGPKTSAAVTAFQKRENLETTGQLGPRTLNALLQ